MALYRATIKNGRSMNGVKLEQGMSVEFKCDNNNPLGTNAGKEVVEAFMKKYGLDVRKGGALNSGAMNVEKIG